MAALKDAYLASIRDGHLTEDPAQAVALDKLDMLTTRLAAAKSGLFRKAKPVR